MGICVLDPWTRKQRKDKTRLVTTSEVSSASAAGSCVLLVLSSFFLVWRSPKSGLSNQVAGKSIITFYAYVT